MREIPGGVRVEHVLTVGLGGRLGQFSDPLIRMYFTQAFADTLTEHARTEFPLLAAGAGAPPQARRLPMRWLWRCTCESTQGQVQAARFLALTEIEYATVVADRPDFVDDNPVLAGHFARSIAPLIAAYRVLERTGDPDPLGALRMMSDARLGILARVAGVFARLPVPWSVFTRLVDKVMASGFPSAGWDISWVEKSDDRLVFDIHGCFYLRAFEHYGVPELTALACHGDDILYQRLPGARFVRTGTLGRGDPACDFRFERLR